MIRSRPIIFGADSVRSIVAGTKVQTRRVCAPSGARVVYVGRAVPRIALRGSPLGNPYRIGRDEPLQQALGRYRNWLDEALSRPASSQTAEIDRLARIARKGALALECWCAPYPCHADVIRDVLIERLSA